MITTFKLVQVSKSKKVKLEKINDDSVCFEANVEMNNDDFNSLFYYCKNNWDEKKYADIEHDGFYEHGAPINAIFKGIKTKL
jgi:hypothetical protein